jgi:hypothetical protein
MLALAPLFASLFATAAGAQTAAPELKTARSSAVMLRPSPYDPALQQGLDFLGRVVWNDAGSWQLGYTEGSDARLAQQTSPKGNKVRLTRDGGGHTVEQSQVYGGAVPWYERRAFDAAGNTLFRSIERQADSQLSARAASVGVTLPFPDWVQVTFPGPVSLVEVDVTTLQDNWATGGDPITHPGLTFTLAGITDFEVQYQASAGAPWLPVPHGSVVGNRLVRVPISFPALTAVAIRVLVKGALADSSRVVEVEALDSSRVNRALASRGATATASSTLGTGYPASAVIDGDRSGANWKNGGGWKDNTPASALPAAATTSWSSSGGYDITTVSNVFGSVVETRNQSPGPVQNPAPGYPVMMLREDTNVAGKQFEVSVWRTNNGTEVWDNQGGNQLFSFDWAKLPVWIADDLGYVVRIDRDASERPTLLLFGDAAYLKYNYDANGNWTEKILIDHLHGDRVLFHHHRSLSGGNSKNPVPPTEETQALMPGYGPVVVWNDFYGPGGYVLGMLNKKPYALIPLGGTGYQAQMPKLRFINLFDEQADASMHEQILYDHDWILLESDMDAAAPTGSPVRARFAFPRWSQAWPTSAPATRTLATRSGAAAANSSGTDWLSQNCPSCYLKGASTVAALSMGDTSNLTLHQRTANWAHAHLVIPSGFDQGTTPYSAPAQVPQPNWDLSQLNPLGKSFFERAVARATQLVNSVPGCSDIFNAYSTARVHDWSSAEYQIKKVLPGEHYADSMCNTDHLASFSQPSRRLSNGSVLVNGTLYVCQDNLVHQQLSDDELGYTMIHEWLHDAGVPDGSTGSVLTDAVRKACQPPACTSCQGKVCGTDSSCGTAVNCGTCNAGTACDTSGQCQPVPPPPTCTPCAGQECGTDLNCGTGRDCGSCAGGAACVIGTCDQPCTPCAGQECGFDTTCGSGTICGVCPDNYTCEIDACTQVTVGVDGDGICEDGESDEDCLDNAGWE